MTWGIATALLEQHGREGLFEVDEAWLPQVGGAARPLAGRPRQPLPRPARPLRRDRGPGRRVGRRRSARAPAAPASSSTPTTRSSPTWAATTRGGAARASSTSGSTTSPRRCPSCSTPSTPSTAAAAATPTPTSAPSSATSATTPARSCGARRPEPDVAATRIELHGMRGSSVTVRTPGGELALELPLPGLYNVYNALAAIAAALELGIAPERIAPALAAMRGAFGRVETVAVDGKQVSILLVKNPAGANEVLRTLKLEAGEAGLDLWIALNDRIADGRDVSWIWDADFELLAGAVRRVTCAGTRAPEMALRLKYAGWPEERDRGRAGDRGVARPGRGGGARPAVRPAHLHRAARAAQSAFRPRPDARSSGDERASIWHDVECGAYAADLPLWEELAGAGDGADPRPRLRHGPRRAAPGAARTRGQRARRRPAAGRRLRRAGAGSAGHRRGRRRPRLRPGRASSSWSWRRCSCCSCSRAPWSGCGCLRCVAAPPAAPAGSPPSRSWSRCPSRSTTAPPLPDTREVDGWVYSSLPVDARVESGSIRVRRLRQTVSPGRGAARGARRDPAADARRGDAGGGRRGGWASVPPGRRQIPATDAHVGSTVVLLEREA